MASGVEVAGLVLAIIAAAKGCSKLVHRITDEFRHAPREIQHFKLISLWWTNTLAQLPDIVKEKQRRSYADPESQKLDIQTIYTLVTSLEAELEDLERVIQSANDGRFRLFNILRRTAKLTFMDPAARERINRIMMMLHFNITTQWSFERCQPVHIDLDDLRSTLKQLAGGKIGDKTLIARSLLPLEAMPWQDEDISLMFQSSSLAVLHSVGKKRLATPTSSQSVATAPDEDMCPQLINSLDHHENLPPTETLKLYNVTRDMAAHALAQGFPDIAADYQYRAIRARDELITDEAMQDDFGEWFQTESSYVTILLSCLESERVEEGKQLLEKLADRIDRSPPASEAEKAFHARAWEDVGSLHLRLSLWEPANRHLRKALDYYLERHGDRQDDIKRICRSIRDTFLKSDANDYAGWEAFRRVIMETVGLDPLADSREVEATRKWCCDHGIPIESEDPTVATPNFRDRLGNMAIHKAVQDEEIDESVLRYLAKDRDSLDAPNDYGFTPLMLAVRKSQKRAVEVLVEEGANLHICTPEQDLGNTILHFCEDADILKFLLHKLNRRRPSSISAHAISPSDDTAGKRSLLVTIDTGNLVGDTPLHYACARGYRAIVNVLLEYGANVNLLGHNEKTPLLSACHSNKFRPNEKKRVVMALIAHGADPTITDCDGRTAAEGLRGFRPAEITEMFSVMSRRGSSTSRATRTISGSSAPQLPSLRFTSSSSDLSQSP
ncbi:hypothetical protein B0I35DRAFT_437385 [Stachybotrys elegans]|uniref:protein S-acyltransferase n=1 Tax=Stachybotrys elegans TaxID=80388 RepID=A0A8K0WNK9_9HYPO|nr:hypothetical protein B0I35DRAFT_437385 [Stachybotrys elegans]